jgi:hypothetical protein
MRNTKKKTPRRKRKAKRGKTPTPAKRRTARRAASKKQFLAAFEHCGRIDKAAEQCGAGRTTVYRWMHSDPDFADALELARAKALTVLEDEAFQRAKDGVTEPVYQNGKLVGAIQKYSNTLLIFLLKCWGPKRYGDRQRHEVSAPDGKPMQVTIEVASGPQSSTD